MAFEQRFLDVISPLIDEIEFHGAGGYDYGFLEFFSCDPFKPYGEVIPFLRPGCQAWFNDIETYVERSSGMSTEFDRLENELAEARQERLRS